jgi:hypothetical protein
MDKVGYSKATVCADSAAGEFELKSQVYPSLQIDARAIRYRLYPQSLWILSK